MGSFKVKNDGFLSSKVGSIKNDGFMVAIVLFLAGLLDELANKVDDGDHRSALDKVVTALLKTLHDDVFVQRHDKAGKSYALAFLCAVDGHLSDAALKAFRGAFDRSVEDCKRRNLPTIPFLSFMAELDDSIDVGVAQEPEVALKSEIASEPEIAPVAYVPSATLPAVPARLLKELRMRDIAPSAPAVIDIAPVVESAPMVDVTPASEVTPVIEAKDLISDDHYERFARRSSVIPLQNITLGDAPARESQLPENLPRKRTLQGLQPVVIMREEPVLLDESMRRPRPSNDEECRNQAS